MLAAGRHTVRLNRVSTLEFRLPAAGDEQDVRQALREFDDFVFASIADMPWDAFVARAQSDHEGRDMPPERVPCSFLLAFAGTDLVGRVSIRYELNDYLRHVGGHIGYGVRPQFQGRGYATQMLRHGLQLLANRDVSEALVTCDDPNLASAAVITKCGGKLADIVHYEGVDVRRYWIRLPTRSVG